MTRSPIYSSSQKTCDVITAQPSAPGCCRQAGIVACAQADAGHSVTQITCPAAIKAMARSALSAIGVIARLNSRTKRDGKAGLSFRPSRAGAVFARLIKSAGISLDRNRLLFDQGVNAAIEQSFH